MEKDNLSKSSVGFNKVILFSILIGFVIMYTPSESFAHRIDIFAYVEGNKVFTGSFFDDGTLCKNSKITVLNSEGNILLEGITDEAGEFSFIPHEKTDLKIIVDAGMGHRAECTVPAGDLEHIFENRIEKQQQEKGEMNSREENNGAALTQSDLEQIRLMIDDTLDEKLKPIVKSLAKLEKGNTRPSSTEVIGGIGYIFGIMGLIIYFRNLKNKINDN